MKVVKLDSEKFFTSFNCKFKNVRMFCMDPDASFICGNCSFVFMCCRVLKQI